MSWKVHTEISLACFIAVVNAVVAGNFGVKIVTFDANQNRESS